MIKRHIFNAKFLFVALILAFCIYSCKNSTDYDGRYCAKVNYLNPNTQTQSEYTLTITVERNILKKVDFPQGYLAAEDLPMAVFSKDGQTQFTLPNNYKYSIFITGSEGNCLDNVPLAKQCKGITQKGERCKKLTDNADGLCYHHKDQ